MSPILVRPVREQLEHDRIIRQLQGKFRRKYETLINPGVEQNAPIGTPPTALYPDVVLLSLDRGRKLQGLIEVETGESVNHLEALAQWQHLSKLRAPFHLYVPAGMVDVARRLCEDNHIYVHEIWSYHPIGDQMRFTMVHRNKEAPPPLPKKPAVPVKPMVKPLVVKETVAAKPRPPKAVSKPTASKPSAKKSAPARKKAPVKNVKNVKKAPAKRR